MDEDRENIKILVSICCVTYNQKKYITECLNGFINQKTNFNYEILVHDDASTDGTSDIVKKYEKYHPKLFRNVYQKQNQFLIQNTLTNILFPMAKGKYIALCEGDDYWTDPLKLQKQVDFLDQNSKCSYVFTKRKILNPDGSFTNERTFSLPNVFDLHTLLKKKYNDFNSNGCFQKKIFPNK
jgi:glycosyltransferase involved in cell wall biosynthesis